MAARTRKIERRMDLSTERKESNLETITDEVEAKGECLIERITQIS